MARAAARQPRHQEKATLHSAAVWVGDEGDIVQDYSRDWIPASKSPYFSLREEVKKFVWSHTASDFNMGPHDAPLANSITGHLTPFSFRFSVVICSDNCLFPSSGRGRGERECERPGKFWPLSKSVGRPTGRKRGKGTNLVAGNMRTLVAAWTQLLSCVLS